MNSSISHYHYHIFRIPLIPFTQKRPRRLVFDLNVAKIKTILATKSIIAKTGSKKKELLRSWLLSCTSQDITPVHYLVFVCQLLIETPRNLWDQSCAYHLFDLYKNNQVLKASVDNTIEHLPQIKACLVDLIDMGNTLRSKKLQRWVEY